MDEFVKDIAASNIGMLASNSNIAHMMIAIFQILRRVDLKARLYNIIIMIDLHMYMCLLL